MRLPVNSFRKNLNNAQKTLLKYKSHSVVCLYFRKNTTLYISGLSDFVLSGDKITTSEIHCGIFKTLLQQENRCSN